MCSELEKQIAFEMTKAIIEERKQYNISQIQQADRIVTPEYWAELYRDCLEQIKNKSI